MSLQGPIIVVSTTGQPAFTAALDEARTFPLIDTTWSDVSRAVAKLQPAAALVDMQQAPESTLSSLATQIAAMQPYLPLIAIDPETSLPENAIPLSNSAKNSDRLAARLRAALRVRTLHATVMRRCDDRMTIAETDPVRDATVLLIGRGAGYAALSVAYDARLRGYWRDRPFDGRKRTTRAIHSPSIIID